jgi:peroxiredoxin
MVGTSSARWFAFALAVATCGTALAAESRTWTDKTGKFTITAELVAVQGGNVVLRQSDGSQLTIPIKQLSLADRELVEGKADGKPARGAKRASHRPDAAIAEVAEQFFTELRSEKRDTAAELLTKKAQELAKGDKSPLAALPAPEEGDRSIRVGRAKLDGKLAEVPVQVRAAGHVHKTKLHLRLEDDQWRVFAMTAMYPGGEKSLNLEVEAAQEGEGDPLQALVGKPFPFAGLTLDGTPLDLSRYQGKVVLVSFWATWCEPCKKEMPNQFDSYQKHYKDGFDVVAVSVDEDLEALANFVTKAKPPWAVVADVLAGKQNSMAGKYGIQSLPASVLIDQQGKVAAVNCRGKELGEQLDKVLAAAARGGAGPGGAAPGGPAPGGPAASGQPSKVGSVDGKSQLRSPR